MPRSISMFLEGFYDFKKELIKKLSLYDLVVVKHVCFVLGLLFACLFPRFSKKLSKLLSFAGIFMLIPVAMKMIRTFKEVFRYRYW